jgi:hypothetical protein
MDAPPLDGAAQLTVTDWLCATTVTEVGAPGTVAGVTAIEAAEAALSPTAFVALTVKV